MSNITLENETPTPRPTRTTNYMFDVSSNTWVEYKPKFKPSPNGMKITHPEVQYETTRVETHRNLFNMNGKQYRVNSRPWWFNSQFAARVTYDPATGELRTEDYSQMPSSVVETFLSQYCTVVEASEVAPVVDGNDYGLSAEMRAHLDKVIYIINNNLPARA